MHTRLRYFCFILVCYFAIMISSSINANAVYARSELKAAFVRGQDIWVKDGTSEKQITYSKDIDAAPQWSFDGSLLVYSKHDGLWVYSVKTGKKYHLYQKGAHNYRWSPNRNVLAFQDETILDILSWEDGTSSRFRNLALGVGQYSWMPDGKEVLVTASAHLLPDGWTQPILYRIPIESTVKSRDMTRDTHRFFTIPGTVSKGSVKILSITTSAFKWSQDGNWIAFHIHPTASWSMDSNMLCVLSSDGKVFTPLDEMAAGFSFHWAPTHKLIGYIEGGGRIVIGFKNKNLKVKRFEAIPSLTLTPRHQVDLDFTWIDDGHVVVSRTVESEWSNDPEKRPLPKLYGIDVETNKSIPIVSPPAGYGDVHPEFLHAKKFLTWTRTNRKQHDVWVSASDDTYANVWIQNIDGPGSVSWFDH